MEKQQVIKGAILLIKRIAEEKGLEVEDSGTGHGFEGSFWEGILKDESGIPSVNAANDSYSIGLRSFWGSPEIDIHRVTEEGEELLVLNYSDMVKKKGTNDFTHTGDFRVREVRVEAFWDYKKCINEVYDMIEEIEMYARKERSDETHGEGSGDM